MPMARVYVTRVGPSSLRPLARCDNYVAGRARLRVPGGCCPIMSCVLTSLVWER